MDLTGPHLSRVIHIAVAHVQGGVHAVELGFAGDGIAVQVVIGECAILQKQRAGGVAYTGVYPEVAQRNLPAATDALNDVGLVDGDETAGATQVLGDFASADFVDAFPTCGDQN